jgi:hypothetical protein
MTFFVAALALVLIAVLAPRFGADSRRLTDRAGGPPDVLNHPSDRHRHHATASGDRPTAR